MDADTLRRAQRGDGAAQADFLRRMGPSVLSLVRRLGARADVEDQVQDLFTHLLEVLPQFRPDGPAQLSTWVFTVAHRWLLMQKRRRTLHLVPLEGGLSVPDDARPTAEDEVQRKQMHALLGAELDRLPDEQRRVFVLTQLHHQPLEAVAEAEGLPLGTVKSRLHRARAELVLRMGEALDAPALKGGPRATTR